MHLQAIAAGIAATILSSAGVIASEPASGPKLVELVSGKRVYLAVPLGGEFPLHYKPDGFVTGDGTRVGLGRFLAPKETGRWWVDGARLCQKWPTWYKGRTSCFTITPTGPGRISWTRDDGTSGRARIEG